jgi:iron complex transport system substrate-binding protein
LRKLIPALLLCLAAWAAPPQRIVSTAPSITETLFALGLGPRVVGVTEFCDFPAEARRKPKIGTFLEPNFERILAQRPDLVLVVRNPVQLAERLSQLGLRTVEVPQDTVAEILASIREIGRLAGVEPRARALAASIERELGQVRQRAARLPRKKVLFLLGRSPGSLQAMVGAGPGTFLDELIQTAGGVNVLAGSPMAYPRVSVEQILAADPDVILDMGDFAHQDGKSLLPPEKFRAMWAPYSSIKAVRENRVLQIANEAVIRPGPRVAEAARLLLQWIHGVQVR